jgi:hypothetical protein
VPRAVSSPLIIDLIQILRCHWRQLSAQENFMLLQGRSNLLFYLIFDNLKVILHHVCLM